MNKYNHRYYVQGRKHAHNSFKRWTPLEVGILLEGDRLWKPDALIAHELGRSLHSVQQKRGRLYAQYKA